MSVCSQLKVRLTFRAAKRERETERAVEEEEEEKEKV